MDRPFISGGTRVAVIGGDDDGALLVQRVCRIRTASPAVAVVLKHVLMSARFLAHIEPDLTGVSVPHLSETQIGSVAVPWLTESEYAARANALSLAGEASGRLVERLTGQVELLVEHRQALITETVTGAHATPGLAA